MTTVSAADIIATLEAMGNDAQRQVLLRFFKTGAGQYGAGDEFLGLRVPQTRRVVREARLRVALPSIELLLASRWHEVRLCGLLLLVEEMSAALPRPSGRADAEQLARRRQEIAGFYLAHARSANNWDLVDLSASPVLGAWLLHPLAGGAMPDRGVLDRLAGSDCLWEQRIAIVATHALIRAGEHADTLRIATLLLSHPHDLIHKAVGWMLREVGKRDVGLLRDYLRRHRHAMARTTLRYAIERLAPDERREWLNP